MKALKTFEKKHILKTFISSQSILFTLRFRASVDFLTDFLTSFILLVDYTVHKHSTQHYKEPGAYARKTLEKSKTKRVTLLYLKPNN